MCLINLRNLVHWKANAEAEISLSFNLRDKPSKETKDNTLSIIKVLMVPVEQGKCLAIGRLSLKYDRALDHIPSNGKPQLEL